MSVAQRFRLRSAQAAGLRIIARQPEAIMLLPSQKHLPQGWWSRSVCIYAVCVQFRKYTKRPPRTFGSRKSHRPSGPVLFIHHSDRVSSRRSTT
uniref:Integron gene cassette protein n=1 Tax=Panagrellus redivivus TaxID=6233 RepID=A0A7E4ZUZ8_PANRE